MKAKIAAATTVFLMSGCVNVALRPVHYENAASIKTNKIAVVQVYGETRKKGQEKRDPTVPVGGDVHFPTSPRASSPLDFNALDQIMLVSAFCRELARLGVVKSCTTKYSGKGESDVLVRVFFAGTSHTSRANQYTLDVIMELVERDREVRREYRVVSSAGDSLLERMGTDAAEGKQKAAQKLMNRLVAGVESFLRQSSRHDSDRTYPWIGRNWNPNPDGSVAATEALP